MLLAAATVAFVGDSAQARGNSGPTIVDIVLSNPDIDGDGEGDFDTLAVAVGLADISVLNRLSSNGQNTVFAPTDAAFDAAFMELEMIGIMPEDILSDTDLLTLIQADSSIVLARRCRNRI